ncbi:uncharacterized protein EAF02_011412 [Botrytis sinoallii]|uniref:uncharacterized protein n=1 Tax=Botrytis sinoallii TaxID=1463999 RepID=UPI0019001BC7|nr:uncharacterized protein EAF02_011412 [Botrytis sinoallii]KAF7856153.1 hypothetical protein EAF02_011412 [Botrytis sinoallii]
MDDLEGQKHIHPKRIVLCCDGTWMDSDDGFTKPTLIPYKPTGTLQTPSNVTRLSRCLRRYGPDGTHQIIYYHSGVGTGSSMLDTLSGGMLGTGISENIREVYSFIAANYTPGDEIILVGFSRGAFTARSVAGMISDIGLLTRYGMSNFYAIFKDQENFRNANYKDIFPDIPFPNKPKDGDEYKKRLVEQNLTRVYDPNGSRIRVHAVAVWDTVGSLGIPNIALLAKLGLPHSTKEYKFHDTNLSGYIRHAFQALALDEHRRPFSPAVWEIRDFEDEPTDLRQVWFPGSHANVGGGYDDQEIANITLAWMMDQLASIGVSFHEDAIDIIFQKSVHYYETLPPPSTSIFRFSKPINEWATPAVYEKHHPVRPWALGKIYNSDTGIWTLAGKETRTPGLYHRLDPDTGASTGIPMTHTNERIHSSVRIRLDLGGLGEEDMTKYKCPALLKKGPWRLDQIRIKVTDPIPPTATWGPTAPAALDDERTSDLRWVWEYDGPEKNAPVIQTIIEENLGPYERKLLLLNKGKGMFHKVIDEANADDRRAIISAEIDARRENRVKYQESLMHRRRKKKKRRSHRTSRAGTEKNHMTADDLLLGDTAVNGDFGRRRNRAGRDEVVSYGSGPVIIGEELEPDEKLDKLHGFSSYNGERRKSRQPGVYGQGFGERLGELPVRSRTRVTADPRDSELEKDMREMEERRAGISGNTTNATNSRIRIVPVGEEENDKKDKPRRSRVEIQPQEQDEIVVFEEHDSPDERTNRRSRVGARDRARSTTRTIDTWERSEVGESTIFTPTPRNRSRGRSGLGERELKSPGVSVRERELSVPRSVDSWERSDIESTVLTQREREKSRTPKSRGARARSTARTIDTWERSEVGASTVMSGGRTPGTRSGVSARARERSRVDRERERERERVEKERERERDSGYEGEGERWHGRGYNYDERKRGHSPVPVDLGE